MEVSLHPHQSEIFEDPARFKVVAAGRRFGKSYLAATLLFVEAAKDSKVRSDGSEISLTTDVVYYVAPTFKQGRETLWNVMMEMGRGLIKSVRQNEGEIVLTNDRIIRFKGADDPDSLRGVGLSYVVLDEYAFMKPDVWEYIIYPALARAEGGAMFIGTPSGKNHFFRLYSEAKEDETGIWKAWTYSSKTNPFLTGAEVEAMSSKLSEEARRQELEASFEATGGKVFNASMFPITDVEPSEGEYFIACDLAGFSNADNRRKSKVVLDDHAIAVVKVWRGGWYVKDIIHGRWDVRQTALRILKAWEEYRPVALGIERGMAFNAVLPYLHELQQKHQMYFDAVPLTHGNNKKEDRIKWSLQGRAEEGKITLAAGDWNREFLSQAVDFPNHLSHDDLIDAVSYIDQMADGSLGWDLQIIDTWVPYDLEAGY